MRKYLTILAGATLAALLATGCSIDTPSSVELPVAQPSGAAVFGNYVAAGNSLTAGYMDAGVIMNGQANSYPQLIASSFGYPAGSFFQPLIASPGVGTTALPPGGDDVSGVLHYNAALGSIVPLGTLTQAEVPSLLLAASVPVPYSNLGVPGATTLDVTDALDSTTSQAPGNSYFDLILRNPTFGNVSMRDQLIARGPTIATLWIGNNDILGGATSGTPIVGTTLTPATAFGAMYTALLDGVTQGVMDRHGFSPLLFVANIPSITSIPYFMPPTVFNGLVAAATEGAITDVPTEENDVRFFRFPALSHIAANGAAALPLAAEWTLTEDEVTTVETLVGEYNTIIADAIAARANVFLYDANAELAGLTPAESAHFLALLAPPAQGGVGDPAIAAETTLFSLDGVHPNNRGYGVVANGFLAAINGALGTQFPMVDVDALVWDPTYGTGFGGAKADAFPTMSIEAASAVEAILK